MPALHGLLLRQLLSRYRASELFWIAVLLFVLSDSVAPERFGPAAPLVRSLQQLGGDLAVWVDAAIRPHFGADLPVPPELLLGGGAALALDLGRGRGRGRARREPAEE